MRRAELILAIRIFVLAAHRAGRVDFQCQGNLDFIISQHMTDDIVCYNVWQVWVDPYTGN